MINKTIGTGGDYADFTAMFLALDNAVLVDNWTVTQISDIVVPTSAPTWSRVDFGGFTFRITQATPLLGNPNNGYKITYNGTNLTTIRFDNTGLLRRLQNGILEVDNLKLSAGVGIVFGRGFTNATVKFHDCLMADLNVVSQLLITTSNFGTAGLSGGVRPNLYGWNNVAYRPYGTAASIGGAATIAGLQAWENCIMANDMVFSTDEAAVIGNKADLSFTNVYATGWNFSGGAGTLVVRSCLGSSDLGADATGPGAVIDLVQPDQFVSLDWASADFFKVLNASPLADAGAMPAISGNSLGIRGNARPTLNGTVSIGADQAVIAPLAGGLLPGFVPGL